MSRRSRNFSRSETERSKHANPFGRSQKIDRKAPSKIASPKMELDAAGSVFVSYAREDLRLVAPLVTRLRNRRVPIIWDQDFLPGDDFEAKIRSSIEGAAVVTVVWSPISIKSGFVRDEARLAYQHNKLAPVATDDLNMSDIPLGFGSLQATRISQFETIAQGLRSRTILAQAEATTARPAIPLA